MKKDGKEGKGSRKIWKQKEMMVKMSASSDCLFNVKLLPQHSFLHSEKFSPFFFANMPKKNNPSHNVRCMHKVVVHGYGRKNSVFY